MLLPVEARDNGGRDDESPAALALLLVLSRLDTRDSGGATPEPEPEPGAAPEVAEERGEERGL
jgi:hypothetical protein